LDHSKDRTYPLSLLHARHDDVRSTFAAIEALDRALAAVVDTS
jgi:hypothetical protein